MRNNPLNALFEGATNEVRGPVNAPNTFVPDRAFTERCQRCNGTGRFRSYGRCFACSGRGQQTFSTPPEARARDRERRAERRVASHTDLMQNVEIFKTVNPDVWTWIETSRAGFAFAQSMYEALHRYGDLTEKQLIACLKCIAGRERATGARQQREANAPVIDISRIEQAFEAVTSAGLRYPKLNLATFEFKPASERSRWHGSIYVTEAGQYLGRVTAGRFVCTRECTPEQEAAILEAAADPETAAVAYGKRTGTCACCRRELTDPESIDRGIGPVCATKWGW